MKSAHVINLLVISFFAISALEAAAPRQKNLDDDLHQAVNFNNEEGVRQALLNRANPAGPNEAAIMFAAIATNNETILGMLLDAGLDPNITTQAGSSALHRAAQIGNKEMVELLLGFGANATATNAAGKTPAELTTNPEIQALLTATANPLVKSTAQ